MAAGSTRHRMKQASAILGVAALVVWGSATVASVSQGVPPAGATLIWFVP